VNPSSYWLLSAQPVLRVLAREGREKYIIRIRVIDKYEIYIIIIIIK
jgi:hypothetical protein